MDPQPSFRDLLEDAIEETGADLARTPAEVAAFAATKAAELAGIVDEPGFARAVRAARDQVVLFAAGEVVEAADAFDARVVGVIQGALFLGARALVPG